MATVDKHRIVMCALAASLGFVAYRTHFQPKQIIERGSSNEKNDAAGKHWSYEVKQNESPIDLQELSHYTDHFNGVRIDPEKLPKQKDKFGRKLTYSLRKWKANGVRGIFLKLPLELASHLHIALSNGFTIHHARPEYIMLIKWISQNESNMIPEYCHTYIATGCFIINKLGQAVVIREIWNRGDKNHWKLPGGAVDRLENIFDAALREAKEETGLDTTFKGVLHFRHFVPFRFKNTGDIYFICLLKYDGPLDGGKEFEIDKNEIAEIKWMDIESVLSLESQKATFGSQETKDFIQRNANTLIKHWNEATDSAMLQTFMPINTKIDHLEFDPYLTLNVARDASTAEIQEKYKKLSRTFHPDRNADSIDTNALIASREKFESITKAKEILCDSQKRAAFDSFGAKGVEMLQRDIYNELRALKIGKQYRNDEAVEHLLKYYLKREAKIELDKMISSFGHCEIGIDATSLYEEIVDLVYRNETLPQFVSNLMNGIPTLQVVVNEQTPIYSPTEPVRIVDDDYDFEQDEVDYVDDDEVAEYNDDGVLSMSELMSVSVEDQVAAIQTALEAGDMTTLKNIPVQRMSVRPNLLSFLISLGYQYEYDDRNTVVLSSTQYISDMNAMTAANKLYFNQSIEWHSTYNQYLKFVTACSMSLSSLSSRFSISRNLDDRTSIDISLYFDWLDTFWTSIWNGFGEEHSENAADLFENVFADSSSTAGSDNAYWKLLPEIFTVFKNGVVGIYNLMNKASKKLVTSHWSIYPGFDVSFGIRRLIFNEWMAVSSIRMGRTPSFSWNIMKSIGPKQWNFQFNVGHSSGGLLVKHEKRIDKTLCFYVCLGFNVAKLLYLECGFNKLMIDDDLQEMMDSLKNEGNVNSTIDMSTSFGIDISLKQGISAKLGLKRGPSQFNVPIKLAESPNSMKQILLSFAIPMLTYYGYKFYYGPYSKRVYNQKIVQNLNEKGLLLHNKRQFALQQQSVVMKESNQNKKMEEEKNGLVILCSFYGASVESKLFDAVRSYLELDEEEDEDENNDNEECEDEVDDDERSEEKEMNDTETATGQPPPLLFEAHTNKNKKKRKKAKKDKVNKDRYNVRLNQVDWLSIEDRLENLMRNNHSEDIHLPSFLSVRVALQYMVDTDKSVLTLSSGTKSHLIGFYDCCPDEYSDKELFVVYKYDNEYRFVTVSDFFPLSLPNKSHLEWFNCRKEN